MTIHTAQSFNLPKHIFAMVQFHLHITERKNISFGFLQFYRYSHQKQQEAIHWAEDQSLLQSVNIPATAVFKVSCSWWQWQSLEWHLVARCHLDDEFLKCPGNKAETLKWASAPFINNLHQTSGEANQIELSSHPVSGCRAQHFLLEKEEIIWVSPLCFKTWVT